MRRKQMILGYPTLSKEDIRTLTAQKLEHIDPALLITPYNNDKEWEERIKSMWWAKCNNDEPGMEKMYLLRDKLLAIGGCEVCMPVTEDDYDDIMQYGQIWDNLRTIRMKGRPSQCHSNAAELWYNNRKSSTEKDFAVIICTGYALSDDGLWRQHSWLIQAGPRSNVLVETTEPRVCYFGFGMTFDQAEDFEYWNS